MKLIHGILAAALLAAPAAAQARQESPSETTIAMRWHLLDPEVNSFTFRNANQVFEYRTVERGGPVWDLPRATPLAMPGDYDAWADRTFTNAFMVLRNGDVVFEDYRNRMGPATPHIAFSMTKTITAMLVGQALANGEIGSLDDLAVKYVPALAEGGYNGVTVRNLLEMRSGAAIEERYDFGENPSLAAKIHETAIIRNQARFADFAVGIGRRADPGAEFNYATLDTAVLGWVLEQATGQKFEQLMQDRIWHKLGAEHAGFFLADGPPGAGRALNGMGYNATLRDFGRLGQLMLNDGMANGARILPEGWVAQMTAMKPTGVPDMPGYGFQTWQVDHEPGAYSAVGLAGQFIYVHPSTKTVIVKLSYFPPVEPEGLGDDVMKYFAQVANTP